ncbi:MAG: sodium:calcium antiporter [Thermoproteota archaeon]
MNELIGPIVTMFVSLATLLISSNIAIKNAVKISEITGLGKSRIGFTFVATSTSLPELAVALFASVSGEAAVSVGNVLGSNVANICLIIGLGVILYTLKSEELATAKFKPDELDTLYLGIFTASIIPTLLISFLPASRIVGFLLIIIYVYQTYKIITKKELPLEETEEDAKSDSKKLMIYVLLAFLGIIGVVLSADFLVDSTVKLALLIGIPSSVLSATIVAVGTSFPELSLDIQAMLKDHVTLAFGDVIGSCFTNITLILGITLLFSPVRINIRIFSDLITFSILANIVLWYLMHRGNLGWKEGLYLLLLYGLFIASIMGILVFPD